MRDGTRKYILVSHRSHRRLDRPCTGQTKHAWPALPRFRRCIRSTNPLSLRYSLPNHPHHSRRWWDRYSKQTALPSRSDRRHLHPHRSIHSRWCFHSNHSASPHQYPRANHWGHSHQIRYWVPHHHLCPTVAEKRDPHYSIQG